MRSIFERQRHVSRQEPFPIAAERRETLAKVRNLLADKRVIERVIEAISQDFGYRSPDETISMEIVPNISLAKYYEKNLGRWMKPRKRHVSIWFKPARNYIVPQPLGVIGIIVPWNYPLFLAVGPMLAALAAGNRVMLKTSEYAPTFGKLLKELMASIFSEDQVAVINGGVTVAQSFSELPWDHLLFTGSTSVGKHVMRAAAANLVPVTLELGGKSPAIIGPDYPLHRAVDRIMWGKCLNAGQTCVAPDYVLVPRQQVSAFIDAARKVVARNYPNLASSPDFSNIIAERHVERLKSYMQDAVSKGAQAIPMADAPLDDRRRMVPTLISGVSDDMVVMQEEIFGPLLPVVPYDSFDDAIAFVNARPRPLALYCFEENKARIQQVMSQTVSGGVAINDVLLHFGQDDLPMGGVGPSGMGSYHGKEGFVTFSQMKPVFAQSKFSLVRFVRPPYGQLFRTVSKLMMR
ncbi:coniferyl aldehyde dehydrogenase [Burkholderiaceae bacterium DAT-1]|nr:coniferyl aldehyde dehydrogenase [Burkholderiaceae bacterium DAT-1]